MANLSLHHLIQSIAGAVAEAQDKIQRFQISTVRQYFDENNRPVSVDVRLPSLSQGATEEDERMVRVPLLSLVSPRLLGIKDVEISFEVALNGQEEPLRQGDQPDPSASAGDGEPTAWPMESHTPLSVDLGARRNGDAGSMARLTLRVESQPPSEGMARLIQHLDKMV
ncbi:MAG: DUF2589 domain-containing protein [Rhodospirillaceae bacterium]|nr:DUF2589 domain-containing protein [Rhodospirillales bacterium]